MPVLNRTYTTLLLRLSWLAPDITPSHPAGTSAPDADGGQTRPRHADSDLTGRHKEQRSASTDVRRANRLSAQPSAVAP